MSRLSYHERYLAGEHVPVWRELIALGAAVREEPTLSDAMAVCREIVSRSRTNLKLLHTRLIQLGYEFAEPDLALVEAGPDAVAEIVDFEREFGTLPLIARAWYESLRSVAFEQAESQRMCGWVTPSPRGPDVFGLGSHAVLVVQSLAHARSEWHLIRDEARQSSESPRAVDGPPDEPFEYPRFLRLGGWASNCEPKEFELPGLGVDGVIFDDGAGEKYFVDDLRLAFEWGGFPFWRRVLTKPDFSAPFEYRPNYEKLLPILKDGLAEL